MSSARANTTTSRPRPTEMALKRDVPWWTNTVGATSATPYRNVFLRGPATPVLVLSVSQVPRVAEVSSNFRFYIEFQTNDVFSVVLCVCWTLFAIQMARPTCCNQSKRSCYPLSQSDAKPSKRDLAHVTVLISPRLPSSACFCFKFLQA